MSSWEDLPDIAPAQAPKASWEDLPDVKPPELLSAESPWVQKARSALDTATFGQAANIAGTIDSIPALWTPGKNFSQEVLSNAAKYQKDYDTSVKNEPVAHALGALAQPLPGPGKAQGLSRLAAYFGGGAAGAGLDALGHGASLEDAAMKAGGAGLASAALGKAVDVIPAALASRFKDVARRQAAKAAGATGRDLEKLKDAGKLTAFSDALLDEKIVGFGDKAGDIAKKAAAKKSEAGKAIGKAYEQADAAAGPLGFSNVSAAGDMRNRVLAGFEGSPAERAVAAKVKEEIAALEGMGGRSSFSEAHRVKRGMDKSINFDKVGSPTKEAMKDLRNTFKNSIKEQIESVSPEAAESLSKANSLYGNMSQAAKMAGKAANAQEVARMTNLNDKAMGALGSMLSASVSGIGPINMITGAAGTLGSKLARERGSSSIAATANLASKIMAAVKGSRFEKALQQASMRSPEAVLAMHQALMSREPEYQKTFSGGH